MLLFDGELHGSIHSCSFSRRNAVLEQTTRRSWAPPLGVDLRSDNSNKMRGPQRETTFSEGTAHRFIPPTRAASLLPWGSMDCACNASISSRRDPHCSPFFLGISQQPAAARTVPKSMAGATSRNGRGIEWMLKVSEHAPTNADRCNAPCQA